MDKKNNRYMVSLLIKPASSLCNMRCKYCFYHDVANTRKVSSYGIMTEETADVLIKRTVEYAYDTAKIFFAFQGGEPTLAGLDFFKYFCKKVEENKKSGQKIFYSIQTNGILTDEKWCGFFAQNNFLVGVSLDCERELHDMHRIDINGVGTYDRVIKNISLMDKYKVEYNILSVVTKAMARKPEKVFKEYLKKRYKYIQFIPCLKPFDGVEENKYDLTPELYADFLIEMFRQWKHQLENGNYISIRLFDNLVMLLKGYPAEQCGTLGKCSLQRVIEADGSVYPCDFYVLDKYNCGNIREKCLDEIDISEPAANFLEDKEPVHSLCISCKVIKICGGGCKRYRSFYHASADFCPYQKFLYTVFDQLKEVALKLR